MNALQRFALENELERLDRVVMAAENWSKEYAKDASTHEKLIKTEAKLARVIRKFLHEQSEMAYNFVDWTAYKAAIQAYRINTLIKDGPLNDLDNGFLSVAFDPITVAMAIGSEAFQNIYQLPFGLEPTDTIIQRMAREQIANLIGKTVGKDGSITDNARAAYRISDVTRSDIRESLHTSISMSETIEEATARLSATIDDPVRAEMIAQTETVNAYQSGLLESGRQSGAVGKLWQDIGADDVCSENSDLGPIPIDESFQDSQGNDIDGPSAHPRCRCGMRLIYQAEAEKNGWDL